MYELTVVDELKTALQALLPFTEEQADALQRKVRLEFNYNSNHIEGNTLTYSETELLLIFDETRGNHSLREYEEMKASDVAFQMIEEMAGDKEKILTEQFIKNLNEALLVRPYWKDAITPDNKKTKRKILIGDYKKHSNHVLLENGETFSYASVIETPAMMTDLIDWYRNVEKDASMHPVEIAAILHYRFVKIHPFDDGNGRISRLLMNYVLLKNDLPPVIIRSDDKKNYLSALRDADTDNIPSFIQYIAQQEIASLQLYLKAANNENLEEEEDWKKRISVIKKELAPKETLKTVKSYKIIRELVNVSLPKFLYEIINNLSELDSLFLEKTIMCRNELSHNTEFKIINSFSEANVSRLFAHELKVQLIFKNFTKSIDNPFNVNIEMDFIFDQYKYNIFLHKNLLMYKLYGEEFTEKEIQEVTNKVGQSVTAAIEETLK